ncbi:hypothetical protein FW320_06590 [Azospirillum sp. Vi22]|uniref:LptM family lipoprotein n=1 Tax=Azospirillum baldaniorum TaxID=1064539 RepID=UPI00157AFA06|nr:hypothetical protein [Azospirillum baldaniorum]NUB05843.1 hypothetical protein [Azospirillum baldaniorum]
MRLRIIVAAVLTFSLSGCGQKYVLDGKVYTSKEEAENAAAVERSQYLARLAPLPWPLSSRSVVIAYPSEKKFYSTKVSIAKSIGRSDTEESVRGVMLYRDMYRNYASLAEVIEKKNIFKASEKVVFDRDANVEPSDDKDVIVLVLAESASAHDQFYYLSKRNGRQAIMVDAGLPTVAQRRDSLLDYIKTVALQ